MKPQLNSRPLNDLTGGQDNISIMHLWKNDNEWVGMATVNIKLMLTNTEVMEDYILQFFGGSEPQRFLFLDYHSMICQHHPSVLHFRRGVRHLECRLRPESRVARKIDDTAPKRLLCFPWPGQSAPLSMKTREGIAEREPALHGVVLDVTLRVWGRARSSLVLGGMGSEVRYRAEKRSSPGGITSTIRLAVVAY
jgi:hypothetical protein